MAHDPDNGRNGDEPTPETGKPTPPTDADALGRAHARYGRYLRQAGLPFEPEEFEEEEGDAPRSIPGPDPIEEE